MTEQNAFELVRQALERTLDEPVQITMETDLVEDEVVDSLDSMTFLLELEQLSGTEFPEDGDLVEQGFYKVDRLVRYLTAA
jgi:acyl carrier protein